MPDRPWKAEERQVARLIYGKRYPANSGRRVDVESDRYICQVKHRRTCSLAQLESLAIELDELGRTQSKLGVICVKRRAGRGCKTPRLIVMTETVWRSLVAAMHPDQPTKEISTNGHCNGPTD